MNVVSRSVHSSSDYVHFIKRRAAQGIATLAVRYGLVICINLAGTVALSRHIGPALWGMLGIAQLIGLCSQEIFARGLASYLIKKDTPPTAADIRGTFALQNFLGLIAMGVVVIVAQPVERWYEQERLQVFIEAAAVASYGYALRGVPLALLERDFDYLQVSIIEIVESVVFYAIAIPLSWMGQIEAGLVSAIVLRSWAPTFITFILKPVRPAFWFRRMDASPVAGFGFSVAASSLVNIAIYSVPVIFVGKLSGMNELGLAQMAFSLYSNLLFVTAAVVRLNLSVYARLIEHADEFTTTINQHLRILVAGLVPLVVIFSGLAPIWTNFVFGQRWHGLSSLLLVQAPGYLLAAVFWGVLNPALLVSGKHHLVLLALGVFLIVYSALTRLLSPAWGAMGVAIAFSTTEILFQLLLFWMYGIKRLEYRKIFPEIILGAVSIAILSMCAQHNLLVAFLGLTVYLVLWRTRNWNALVSASKDFHVAPWRHSAQIFVPAER